MAKTIKPQRGVTYECYIGYTDRMGGRVRKGQRYFYMSEFRDFYMIMSPNMTGHCKTIDKDKFTSHFIPLNPIT